MYYFMITVHVIACLLLIVVVLLQAGRGGGLSGAFGVADSQTIFGSRAGDFLTKSTTTMAVVFMIGSLLLAIMSSNRSSSVMKNIEMNAPVLSPSSAENTDDLSEFTIPIGDGKEPIEAEIPGVSVFDLGLPESPDEIPGGRLATPLDSEEQ